MGLMHGDVWGEKQKVVVAGPDSKLLWHLSFGANMNPKARFQPRTPAYVCGALRLHLPLASFSALRNPAVDAQVLEMGRRVKPAQSKPCTVFNYTLAFTHRCAAESSRFSCHVCRAGSHPARGLRTPPLMPQGRAVLGAVVRDHCRV